MEQVRAHERAGARAARFELTTQRLRLRGGRAIMNHEIRALAVQAAADGGANAFRAAGDQHDSACK